MEEKLMAVYDAGCRLFIEKGFKATQVGEIAREAGIATGSMYKWFASKTACLHFCLSTAFAGGTAAERELPMAEQSEEELMEQLHCWTEQYYQLLGEAASRMNLEGMVSCLYDRVSRDQYAVLLLEHCGDVLGEVSTEYWVQRQNLFNVIEKNLNDYMENGQMRRLPYLHALVPSFMSIISWWALHVDFELKSAKIDKATAKQIAMDLAMHAYQEQERTL